METSGPASGFKLEKQSKTNARLGKKIQSICKGIPGLEEAKVEQQAAIPQIRILFNQERDMTYELNAASFHS